MRELKEKLKRQAEIKFYVGFGKNIGEEIKKQKKKKYIVEKEKK